MRRITGLLLFLSLLVMIHISCDEKIVEGEHWYSVSGKVLDSITLQPIDSALLKINDSSGMTYDVTDSLGEFKVPGSGTIILIVLKDGYISKQSEIAVTKDISGLDFYLSK